MNWVTIGRIISQYIEEQWVDDGSLPKTPIQWENVIFDPEMMATELQKPVVPFLRCAIIPESLKKVELGSEGKSYSGSVILTAFTSKNIGPNEVRAMYDKLCSMFFYQTLGTEPEPIYFSDCHVTGQDSLGAWFFLTMHFPFSSESI